MAGHHPEKPGTNEHGAGPRGVAVGPSGHCAGDLTGHLFEPLHPAFCFPTCSEAVALRRRSQQTLRAGVLALAVLGLPSAPLGTADSLMGSVVPPSPPKLRN